MFHNETFGADHGDVFPNYKATSSSLLMANTKGRTSATRQAQLLEEQLEQQIPHQEGPVDVNVDQVIVETEVETSDTANSPPSKNVVVQQVGSQAIPGSSHAEF